MKFYEFWNGTQTCAECGWTGYGSKMHVGMPFNEGAEYDCPQCGTVYGFVEWPTAELLSTYGRKRREE